MQDGDVVESGEKGRRVRKRVRVKERRGGREYHAGSWRFSGRQRERWNSAVRTALLFLFVCACLALGYFFIGPRLNELG